MATSTSQKLKIKEGFSLLTIHAPTNFREQLGPLPANVKISTSLKKFTQLHWFVRNKAQFEKELNERLPLIKGEVICWIYYPKGTSGMQTDLTRDKGWDALLIYDNLFTSVSLISFNETWSAFGLRMKNDADKKKVEKPKERPILDYIDVNSKAVRLPDDLDSALKNYKQEKLFFNTLSFTNRKEYVEWIVSAKREETRTHRINDAVEKLKKRWKNPAYL